MAEAAHNRKVTGSNPVPATSFTRFTKRLHAALRGGFCVSKTRGSTVEARGREVLGNKAKTAPPVMVSASRSAHLRRGLYFLACPNESGGIEARPRCGR